MSKKMIGHHSNDPSARSYTFISLLDWGDKILIRAKSGMAFVF